MVGLRVWIVDTLAVGLLASSISYGRADELPPGPNRELVARECQACHDAIYFTSSHRDRESWNYVIEEMIGNGARFSEDERARILEYLTTALGPRQ